MAVGDAFTPARKVGLHTHHRPAAVSGDAQAGAYVIDDEKGVGPVADLASAAGVGRIWQGLIDKGVVLDRRGEDGGEIVASLARGHFKAFDIVVIAKDLMGFVLWNDADGS